MYKITIIITIIITLLFVSCKKQNNNNFFQTNLEKNRAQRNVESIGWDTSNIEQLPLGLYYKSDWFSPSGKLLRVYNDQEQESLWWGPVYSPIIYLYDKDSTVLATFDTMELISEEFWAGSIDIKYNPERNSFDLEFSLDAPGNYGTGYIDLNTNEYIFESETSERFEQYLQEFEMQNTGGGEEGATLRKHDPEVSTN